MGAEAEDGHPGEPGVEDGAAENEEESVEGKVVVPCSVAGVVVVAVVVG